MNRLHEAYLRWLELQVRDDDGNNRHTYGDLLEKMHRVQFVWHVPNDDNRLMDALDLRPEFFADSGVHATPDQLGPCSVLEVLVGLSRRVAFQLGGDPVNWAWQLIINLELDRYHDPVSSRKGKNIEEKLENLVYRRYSPTGEGGFFPLTKPEDDQTQIEIWYQMSEWIAEIHPEY